MISNALRERTTLLHADLRQAQKDSQYLGSGATIHVLTGRIATAQSALSFAETREAPELVTRLLDLADQSLGEARALMARSQRR